MTKSISKNLTSDGVLNNYNLLPEQYERSNLYTIKSTYFNGSSELEISDHDDLSFVETSGGNPFSISLWVNPRLPTAGVAQYFFRKGDFSGNTNREYICGLSADNKLFLQIWDESSDDYMLVQTNNAWTLDNRKWQHIVFSYRGLTTGAPEDLEIRENGVNLNEAGVTTGAKITVGYSSMENLGSRVFIGHTAFSGHITEVSLYSHRLANSQCKAIYNNGCPTELTSLPGSLATTLEHWWRMGGYSADSLSGNTGAIRDVKAGRNAAPTAASNFDTDAIIDNYPCKIPKSVPFSLRVRGVPFIRDRSAPYKTNLD